VRVCNSVRVRARTRVRACVLACVRACVCSTSSLCVRACVRARASTRTHMRETSLGPAPNPQRRSSVFDDDNFVQAGLLPLHGMRDHDVGTTAVRASGIRVIVIRLA
jgi:hypothetical protein